MPHDLPPSEQINIWREDLVDADSMLSQEDALREAPETFEGYFVVPLVIEK
ncbi:hypothetical protein FWH30_03410 [Microgenomates group bacterium]|nr:hypothetical protein [Microgenomates group bacterium]